MLLALMDEAYTGSTIEDGGGDSESEDSSAVDIADPIFLELLKDENDGIAVCSPFIFLVIVAIFSSICFFFLALKVKIQVSQIFSAIMLTTCQYNFEQRLMISSLLLINTNALYTLKR